MFTALFSFFTRANNEEIWNYPTIIKWVNIHLCGYCTIDEINSIWLELFKSKFQPSLNNIVKACRQKKKMRIFRTSSVDITISIKHLDFFDSQFVYIW